MNAKTGKTIVVVTGSSSGLGQAICEESTSRGMTVYGLDLQSATASAANHQLPVDVTDAGAVADALDRIIVAEGRIDIVFNNAGTRAASTPVLEVEVDAWRRDIDVNLTGAFIVGQAAARHMLGSGGVIVNTVSQLAFGIVPGNAAYVASKAGVAHLTSAMARELAPQGVRVVGVAPGIVETEMTLSLMGDEHWRQERLGRIPAGRFATPHEIARFMLAAASPDAGYVHGATLVIDGGYLIGA